jgi:(2Fe-2S) ferredoxin
MAVYPDGVWYGSVSEHSARAIVKEHLAAGHVPEAAKVLGDLRNGDERKG